MRRPPIACRRAVQSLQSTSPQHIWISDELLSSALCRFFRSSCPHQKRHGSHVPGPLEARRRAAKRRMSLSANFYPQDSFPSSFNLGALFGLGSSSQPSWRYEPPSRNDSEPLGTVEDTSTIPNLHVSNSARTSPNPSPHSAVYSFSPNIAPILVEQKATNPSNVLEDIKIEPIKTNDTTQASCAASELKAAFEAFRSRIADANELSYSDRASLMVEAFNACSPTSNAWKYNTMVIREIRQLKWDPKAILEQLSTSSSAVPDIYSHQSLDLLGCLEKFISQFPHCIPDIHQIHIKLAHTASIKTSSNPYQDTKLLSLVRQLWHSAHLQGVGLDRSMLDLLHSVAENCRNQLCRATLSTIFADVARLEGRILNLIAYASEDPGLLSAAVEILLCIPRKRVSDLVPKITLAYARNMSHKVGDKKAKSLARMHVWSQLLHQLDARVASSDVSLVASATTSLAQYVFAERLQVLERMPTLLLASLMVASQTAAFKDISMSKISDSLTAFSANVEQNSTLRLEPMLGMFMSQVRAKNLPHETLTQMIVDYFVRYAGLKKTAKVLEVLGRRQLSLANAAPLQKVVAKKLAHVRGRKSRVNDAAQLQVYANILGSLGRISSISDHLRAEVNTLEAQRQFQYIIGRAQSDHVLPLVYRNISVSSSPEQRVRLIHQLAHQYTTDITRSQRQAWRAMSYLYQYLQQHSLPIGPLFTKAVVRICIIRPMTENRFVSAKRLIWVCKLVARVEGEEVAKQIEPLFWHWRGDLIQHAKGSYVSGGGDRQSKAHIATMKRLGLI